MRLKDASEYLGVASLLAYRGFVRPAVGIRAYVPGTAMRAASRSRSSRGWTHLGVHVQSWSRCAVKMTARSIADLDSLLADIHQVRVRGYAISDQESEDLVSAVPVALPRLGSSVRRSVSPHPSTG